MSLYRPAKTPSRSDERFGRSPRTHRQTDRQTDSQTLLLYGAFFSTREEKGELALKNKSDCWLLYLVFICSKHIQVSFPITVEAVQYTIDLEERSKCVYLLEHYRHTMWHYFGIIVSIHGCLSLRLRSSDSRIEVLSIY